MRLVVDTNACYTTRAGVCRYVEGLLGGLAASKRPQDDIQCVAWEVANLTYRQPERALKTFYREFIWSRWIAPKILAIRSPDIVHFPMFPFYLPKQTPYLVTLHDLALLRYPHRFRKWQKISSTWRMKQLKKFPDILCISRFTADEAMELLGIPAHRLHIVHSGCNFSKDSLEEKPRAFSVPDDFFLFVGSLEPGKNLKLLRDVYILAEAQGRILPPLVVVGARWEGVAHEGAWPHSWISAGNIMDAHLVYLYRRAQALVFPSIYEGFGFPPLEAMNLGCPVICSPVASLPEVSGEGAKMVELTPSAYLGAMVDMTKNAVMRSEVISRGYVNVERFSWEKTGRETLDLCRSLVKSP